MPDRQQQMRELSERIAALEQQFAQAAAEFAELGYVMGPFLARYQREILDNHLDLVQTQRQIADARLLLGDAEARAAGHAETPLIKLIDSSLGFASVQEQYERVWRGKEAPSLEIKLDEILPPASDELQALFREVVVHLHPQLADSRKERQRRRKLMVQVNHAYVMRDADSLRAVADALRDRSNLPAVVNEQVVQEQRDRLIVLEQAIMQLEGKVFEMRHGDVAKIRAHARLARAQGYDLLDELRQAISQDLQQARLKLEKLQARLENSAKTL